MEYVVPSVSLKGSAPKYKVHGTGEFIRGDGGSWVNATELASHDRVLGMLAARFTR